MKRQLDPIAFLMKGKQVKVSTTKTAVDTETFAILNEMIRNDDTIINAMRSVLSRVLHAPFWFEIPALGLQSDENMSKIIKMYWLPWCEQALDWWVTGQLIPFFADSVEGIPVPRSPEPKSGSYCRVSGEKDKPAFKWFWNSDQSNADPRVKFIVGRKCPDANGKFQCDLISLIPLYRAVKSAIANLPTIIEQHAHVTHALERKTQRDQKERDDKLVHLTADYGASAVGATRNRIEEARVEEERKKQRRIIEALKEQQRKQNQGMTQVVPILLSDTTEMLEIEKDSGLATRLFALPEDAVYKDIVRPSMPIDYAALKREFDIRAAAIMDYPYELITSTHKGVGKAAAIQGAKTFGDDRIRNLARFFETVVHHVLIHLYRPHFKELFKDKDLFPELDVIVRFAVTSNIDDETLYRMFETGVISKATLARYLGRNHNIPEEEMLLN